MVKFYLVEEEKKVLREEIKKMESNILDLESYTDEVESTTFKSKWDRIHETSDYKRFVYLIDTGQTYRGTNRGLNTWINQKFKRNES